MTKKNIILVFFIFIFLLSGNAIAQEPNLKEGLWEITTTIEEPGMPKEMMRQTYKHCLTKKDYIPYKEEDKECKVTNFNVKGNTVTWTIKCKNAEGTSTGTGRVTYKGDTFDGLIKFKDPEGEMTMTMKGRWTGKCPK
ncbi:hypothetical protein THER_0074 [Thermodesulfovibrio sp. N1]|uniref:DUF3617 domain-containing protein n=1 Tax=unclassified Thermodesulfovibrio TaxID=2645936 RepID=UPI00083B9D0F|nr:MULTISPECIES: DUF3617 domain-containing protein [unclassified Thermodesulfovibrio]MDI1472043.1 DUF3617 domain-containing protein [Thermodesulfovibrio sp. 1176]ODA45199.1 hypothetical protein THER_0074 [Thermodesulfovibrio sp. N1]